MIRVTMVDAPPVKYLKKRYATYYKDKGVPLRLATSTQDFTAMEKEPTVFAERIDADNCREQVEATLKRLRAQLSAAGISRHFKTIVVPYEQTRC